MAYSAARIYSICSAFSFFMESLFQKGKKPASGGQWIAPVMAAFIYDIGVWAVIFAIYQFTGKSRVWDLQFWLMPPYIAVHFIALLSGNFTFFPVMQLASTLISLVTLVYRCQVNIPATFPELIQE